MKILIIDDDAGLRKSLSLILSDADYDVVQAEDGEAGLEMARRGGSRPDPLRRPHAQAGWDRVPRGVPRGGRTGPGPRHDGLRKPRPRARGDEEGGVRLHRQAVRRRRRAPHGSQSRGARAAPPGGGTASQRGPGRRALRRDRRGVAGDAEGAGHRREGGAARLARADHGRERDGQGAHRAHAAPRVRARRPRLRSGELRWRTRTAPGVGVLRIREGRVHRSRPGQGRPLRGRARWHALPRRGGRASRAPCR